MAFNMQSNLNDTKSIYQPLKLMDVLDDWSIYLFQISCRSPNKGLLNTTYFL